MTGGEFKTIIVSPDNPTYDEMNVFEEPGYSRKESRAYYNEVVSAYNQLEVGEIMTFPLPGHLRYHNLKPILASRGLTNGEDFAIAKSVDELTGTEVRLKRLSSVAAKIVEVS